MKSFTAAQLGSRAGTRRKAPFGAGRLPVWMAVAVLGLGGANLVSRAADPAAAPGSAPSAGAGERIEASADRMDYDGKTGVLVADGHVRISKGAEAIEADHILVNMKTEEAVASGNVRLQREGQSWSGGTLRYNFKTREGDWERVVTDNLKPFQMTAARTEKQADRFVLRDAAITTCTNTPGRWHYHVRARDLELKPGESVIARRGLWYFGAVPVMYLPWWYQNLNDQVGYTFIPGYNSRMGHFLLTGYEYRIAPRWKGETHLDYRAERGVGVGQDFRWRGERGTVEFRSYYADDQDPLDGDEPAGVDIPSDRYRLLFRGSYSLTDNDRLLAQADILSDRDVREDFFEREYRRLRDPESYLSYSHWGERSVVGALINARLGDTYSAVNRMPEIYGDCLRRPIGPFGLYYENQNALAALERVWGEEWPSNEYSVVRFDTQHRIYRPTRLFGFFNVNPVVGARGTFYSETRRAWTLVDTDTFHETNAVVDAGGVTHYVPVTRVVTNLTAVETPTGEDLRTSAEFGLDLSFKLLKTWRTRAGSERRHIAEPYANYRFFPEPSIEPARLYPFDSVDELAEEHRVDVGVRNKYQARMGRQPLDKLDVDAYVRIHFTDNDDTPADEFRLDAELRPYPGLWFRADSVFNLDDGELSELNGRVQIPRSDLWSLDAEYRYRRDDSTQLAGQTGFYPCDAWHFKLYARYDVEDRRMQEEWAYVQRNFDCMAIKTGLGLLPGYRMDDGSRREDEWRVIVELWLTAFPKFGLSSSHWD
jgi:LPS-assembly protein